MNAVVRRLSELLRPSTSGADRDAIQTLTIDLGIAAAGFLVFGAAIAAGGGAGWNVIVGLKVAAVFLTTFVLSLPPLFALKRFFEVEAPFAGLVSVMARHLALGGVFLSAGAGLFVLLRRGDVDFDGLLAVSFVGLALAGVLIVRAKEAIGWLPAVPAALSVGLFLALLCQGAWAFRPYMDPASPTLFQAKLEWFAGENRGALERLIVDLAGRRAKR